MSAWLAQLDALIERLPVSPRLVRFAVVGASGVVVNLGVVALAMHLLPVAGWAHRVALASGIFVSILTNFLVNDAWTWGDRAKRLGWLGRLCRFYLVSSAAALVQWVVAVGLFEHMGLDAIFGPLALYVAQCLGIGAAMAINFAANHLWTFQGR